MKNLIFCGCGEQTLRELERKLFTFAAGRGMELKTVLQRRERAYALHLRLGRSVALFSPEIPLGQADFLYAEVPQLLLQNLSYLKNDGLACLKHGCEGTDGGKDRTLFWRTEGDRELRSREAERCIAFLKRRVRRVYIAEELTPYDAALLELGVRPSKQVDRAPLQ